MSGDGTTNILTIKNPEKYDLINSSATFNSQFVVLEILKCEQETSSVQCAGHDEIVDYVTQHRLGLLTAFNYVDYGEVEPYQGPLKHAMQWIEFFQLPYSETAYSMKRHSFKEHRVFLEDSLLQILTAPVDFKMLNFETVAPLEVKFPRHGDFKDTLFMYNFDLS